MVENALYKYIRTSPIMKVVIPGTSMEIDPDFDKGIFLYFMSSEGEFFNISSTHEISTDARVIHHITNGLLTNWTELVQGLLYEYQVYKKNNFDCRNLEKTYDFTFSTDHWKNTTILETPYGVVWEKHAKLGVIKDFLNLEE